MTFIYIVYTIGKVITSAIFLCSHTVTQWLSSFTQWTFEFHCHTSFLSRCKDRHWPPLALRHLSQISFLLGVSLETRTCGNYWVDVETIRRLFDHLPFKLRDQIQLYADAHFRYEIRLYLSAFLDVCPWLHGEDFVVFYSIFLRW